MNWGLTLPVQRPSTLELAAAAPGRQAGAAPPAAAAPGADGQPGPAPPKPAAKPTDNEAGEGSSSSSSTGGSPAIKAGGALPGEPFAPEPPPEYVCPISCEIMKFPVTLTSTGQVYDRVYIQRWLLTRTTCPCTGLELQKPVLLRPAHKLRREIEGWVTAWTPWALDQWRTEDKLEATSPLLPERGSGAVRSPGQAGRGAQAGPRSPGGPIVSVQAGQGSPSPARAAEGSAEAAPDRPSRRRCRVLSWAAMLAVIATAGSLFYMVGKDSMGSGGSGSSGGGGYPAPRVPLYPSPSPASSNASRAGGGASGPLVLSGVRLASSSPNATTGSLEVLASAVGSGGAIWGALCEGVGNATAARRVACRQLGWSGSAQYPGAAARNATFVAAGCYGDEASLEECLVMPVPTKLFAGCQPMGLSCTPEPESGVTVRLVTGAGGAGTRVGSGRLEVFHEGEWGWVCGSFGKPEASVVCRELGLGNQGLATPGKWDPAARGKSAPARAWLDGVECSGAEARLQDCALSAWGGHSCGPEASVWVYCTQ